MTASVIFDRDMPCVHRSQRNNRLLGHRKEGTAMPIHNINADENGETHFRDIDITMTDPD